MRLCEMIRRACWMIPLTVVLDPVEEYMARVSLDLQRRSRHRLATRVQSHLLDRRL